MLHFLLEKKKKPHNKSLIKTQLVVNQCMAMFKAVIGKNLPHRGYMGNIIVILFIFLNCLSKENFCVDRIRAGTSVK